jgi:hypothetical protein
MIPIMTSGFNVSRSPAVSVTRGAATVMMAIDYWNMRHSVGLKETPAHL